MTHYKQCRARECEWCAGDHPVYGSGSDRYHVNPGAGVVHESDKFACTAPTLEIFAERCAEALDLAINTVECASIDLSEGPTKGQQLPWYRTARRALGLDA